MKDMFFFSKLHMHIHPMSLEPTTSSPSPTPFYYYKGRKYHWDGLLTSKWKHDMHKHKTVNWLLLIILKFNMLRIHLWWKEHKVVIKSIMGSFHLPIWNNKAKNCSQKTWQSINGERKIYIYNSMSSIPRG